MTDRIHRNPRVTFRRLEDGAGAVLLNVDTGEYRHLNETAALLWTLLASAPTRDELIARVREVISEPPASFAAEIDAFLDGLEARSLIHRSPEAATEGD